MSGPQVLSGEHSTLSLQMEGRGSSIMLGGGVGGGSYSREQDRGSLGSESGQTSKPMALLAS